MIDYTKKLSLKGKVIFVTGGCGLIGAETVRALSSAGAETVILDVSREKGEKLARQIKDSGWKAHYEYFDITKLEDIEKEMERLAGKYKALDGWVNIAYPRTEDWGNKVEHLTIDSWKKNVDMQLNSYAWTSRSAAMIMEKLKTKGSIVNFGSTYGVVGSDFTVYEGTDMTSPMAYSAIKGGIANLTRYLASYFGKQGIRVNTLCPGGVFDGQKEKFVERYCAKTPLKRMAVPEDIAGVVVFLVSDLASYMTGGTVMVDGGWTTV